MSQTFGHTVTGGAVELNIGILMDAAGKVIRERREQEEAAKAKISGST